MYRGSGRGESWLSLSNVVAAAMHMQWGGVHAVTAPLLVNIPLAGGLLASWIWRELAVLLGSSWLTSFHSIWCW